MKPCSRFALVLITLCTLATAASAQKVYRCGSTYSQIPCADGVAVDVQDARTKAQKQEADAITKNDAQAAKALEQTRLKQEAQALQAAKGSATHAAKPANAKASAAHPSHADADQDQGDAAKHGAHKKTAAKKEPQYFTAKPPPEKAKPD